MSISKRADGRWQVNYRENGRYRSRYFPPGKEGKRKAVEFDAEIKLKKAKGEALPLAPREGVYLDEIVQWWTDEKKAQGRAVAWLADWASVFNASFLPTLCDKPAHKITQVDVMTIISAHYASAAQATRNRYIGYLKAALNYGVEHGHLRVNPLAKWKPGKEGRRKSLLTLDDLKKIKAAAPAYLAWAIECAWNLPVRPGEDLFTLRFDKNVRHDRNGVQVHHSKVDKDVFVVCSKGFMRELYARQQVHKSGYLIEVERKKPKRLRGQQAPDIAPQEKRQARPVVDLGKSLAGAAKRAGLHYVPCMYDIRHLWFTTMLDAGHEISVLAHLAGTSVRMIMKNYYEPHALEKTSIANSIPALTDGTQDTSRKVVGITDARPKGKG